MSQTHKVKTSYALWLITTDNSFICHLFITFRKMRKREVMMMTTMMMASLFLMATFQRMKGHWKKRYECNYSTGSIV